MLKVGGFPEFLPKEQKIFDELVKIIEKTYKTFWYIHIQTPAVERNNVLLAKSWDEVSKQIFWLYWLAQWCENDKKDYSLHFDLTVPFARYVLDYENELIFPFKRYQIQPVWRGERQQKWRYREFWQADIDIVERMEVWKASEEVWREKGEYIWHDIEVVWVLMKTLDNIFSKFKLSNKLILRINNKKIIQGLLEYLKKSGLKENVLEWLTGLLDKYHKLSSKDFEYRLKKLIIDWWYSENVAEKFVKLILDFIDWKFDIGLQSNKIFTEGISELDVVYSGVLRFLEWFGINRIEVVKDYSIVRWLDYYTWVVFETFIQWNESLGSICSGWRYDNLTGYIDSKKNYFNGVGGSIGVNRLFDWLKEQTNFWKYEEKYLFLNFGFWENFQKVFQLYTKFLKEGKICSIYPTPDKLKKQFKYADKAGYKYVVILGEDEIKQGVYKIKDLESGKESEFKIIQ